MSTGLDLIRAERERQVNEEGYSLEHDRKHGGSQLHRAALSYVLTSGDHYPPGKPPPGWPWDVDAWKPKDWLRNLVRAGALEQAAIDVENDPTELAHMESCRDRIAEAIDQHLLVVRPQRAL